MYDERFGRVDPSRPSVGRDVNDLCRAGDAKATEVIHDAGFALGASLGSLANILDPEVIVLSTKVPIGVRRRGRIRCTRAMPARRSIRFRTRRSSSVLWRAMLRSSVPLSIFSPR